MMIVSYSFLAHAISLLNASSPRSSAGFGAIGPEKMISRFGRFVWYRTSLKSRCPVRYCVSP